VFPNPIPLTAIDGVGRIDSQSAKQEKPVSNPSRRLAIATAALALTAPLSFAQEPPKAAATTKPPPEIQSLIDSHIKAFNTQDNELFFSVFGDTAIIIDGIAPFRWLNPNAPAKWITDVEKWRRDLGVTREHLSYEMGFWNVEGSSAYAVIAGTLTIMIKDQSIARAGTLAYTFAKRNGVWKIEAQAWGRTS
jgi:ketosteroid isomerase-like protein